MHYSQDFRWNTGKNAQRTSLELVKRKYAWHTQGQKVRCQAVQVSKYKIINKIVIFPVGCFAMYILSHSLRNGYILLQDSWWIEMRDVEL